MWIDTTYRSNEIEIMDDLEMNGQMLIKTLDQIARINKWLGGNRLTLKGIEKLLRDHPKDKPLSIIDLGCGNGDMLREVAALGRKKGFTFQLVGLDANQATIDYAIQQSKNYPEIKYIKQDVLSDEFQNLNYDIALCTLFLHHFEDKIALDFISLLLKKAKTGVVVNDLHRHPMAYYLFKLLTLVINNKMVKTDGLISILRGFKRNELEGFASKLKCKSTIRWRWAFRYQWIIKI